MQGIDYAWSHPNPSAIKAAGYQFVMRYVSHDLSKDLGAAERDALQSIGLGVGLVWETAPRRALDGGIAGRGDGAEMNARCNQLGAPSSMAVFAAVDFDVTGSQLSTVLDYLQAFAGAAGRPAGPYGGFAVCSAWLATNTWAWQTYAWSQGRWSGAQIRQTHNDIKVGGADCDLNECVKAFPFWGGQIAPVTIPPWPGRMLSRGSTGSDVRTWQQRMHDRGWNISVDGIYGPQSDTVCRKFQAEKHLHVDGIVGPATWAASWSAPIT